MENADSNSSDSDVCEGCGAIQSKGTAGCQSLFEEVIAREFSDYRYGRIHRLTVDAYSLQHPDAYMRSGKSFAAHLTGMCAAFEYETSSVINQVVQKWLSTNPKIEKPDKLPQQRGNLKVSHVHNAGDADEHVKRVREWAQDVWEAWAEQHDLARRLISEACNVIGAGGQPVS